MMKSAMIGFAGGVVGAGVAFAAMHALKKGHPGVSLPGIVELATDSEGALAAYMHFSRMCPWSDEVRLVITPFAVKVDKDTKAASGVLTFPVSLAPIEAPAAKQIKVYKGGLSAPYGSGTAALAVDGTLTISADVTSAAGSVWGVAEPIVITYKAAKLR